MRFVAYCVKSNVDAVGHTQFLYTNYTLKPHRSVKALSEPCSQYNAVRYERTYWLQYSDTDSCCLCGKNSYPIQLKLSVNIITTVFSGNQAYVFDKI